MTRYIVVMLLALLCAACGKDDPVGACASSALVGRWGGTVGGQSSTLVFNADCTGSENVCSATFTYPNLTAGSGQVAVTITSTSGGGACLPLGTTSCTYNISGNTMTYNCGAGNLTYVR